MSLSFSKSNLRRHSIIQIINQLFKIAQAYIIHLNFIIATSAGILAAGIADIFALNNYIYYGLFSFFATLCVYNSQRLFKATINPKTPWLQWVNTHKILILIISIISGLFASYFFILLLKEVTFVIVIIMIAAIVISLLYVVRVFGKNIRELPHLKIHSIALTWTFVIVAFPILNENIYNWEILIFFIPAHYLYFVGVAIPFDIRDMKHDLPTQRTIPQVVGVRNAKIISIILLILTAIGIKLVFPDIFTKLLFVLAILIQILLIACTTDKRQEIFYSGFIDGTIALLGISFLS